MTVIGVTTKMAQQQRTRLPLLRPLDKRHITLPAGGESTDSVHPGEDGRENGHYTHASVGSGM